MDIPSLDNDALAKAWAIISHYKKRVAQLEAKSREPIAIIGLACRLPGESNTLPAYWRLVFEGRSGVCRVPTQRWSVDRFYDRDREAPGKIYTDRAAFIEEVDTFDAALFNIPDVEAKAMDPQHRLLLETSWEAIHNAGIDPSELRGRKCGVFTALSQMDYVQLQIQSPNYSAVSAYSNTGNGLSFAAARISYVYGLTGPCMAVDTACSSSLVALHLAIQSLRSGECETAIVGASQLLLGPETFVGLSRMQVLSPNGTCKPFDAAADGYGRGEGVGVIVLMRESAAKSAGYSDFVSICGSATNHGGAASGFTVPNGIAQQDVVESALVDGQIDPALVEYVETHGTGTTLGDPIEVEALAKAYRREVSKKPLWIGSVKGNIGHLEAASGMAGLLKTVLCLKHGVVPAQPNVGVLNPNIPWDKIAVRVPRTTQTFSEGTRWAGVSSFGIGGSNAHIIMRYDPYAAKEHDNRADLPNVLTLSAHTSAGLAANVRDLSRDLTDSDFDLNQLCRWSNLTRTTQAHRIAVSVENVSQLSEALAAFAASAEHPDMFCAPIPRPGKQRLGFLFTGQGSQYVGMGSELYAKFRVFREAIDRLERIAVEEYSTSILHVITGCVGQSIERVDTCALHGSLYAVQCALVNLWGSWGVKPDIVMGHSAGEYAAAAAANAFSEGDGLRLILERARLTHSLGRSGKMAAVLCDYQRAQEAIGQDRDIAIAAINGPSSVVLSGEAEAFDRVKSRLQKLRVMVQRLDVTHPFHSPLIEPMLERFREFASRVVTRVPTVQFVSNVTGEPISQLPLDAQYWTRHAREPVRFWQGICSLRAAGASTFLEIGPAPMLLAMGQGCIPEDRASWIASLRRPISEMRQMSRALAQLYIDGAKIDWQQHHRTRSFIPTVAHPRYPFLRKVHWIQRPEPLDAKPAVDIKYVPEKSVHAKQQLYGFTWSESDLPPTPAVTRSDWIVIGGDCGMQQRFAREVLSDETSQIVTISADDGASARQLERLLEDNERKGATSLSIVCVESVDSQVEPDRLRSSVWRLLQIAQCLQKVRGINQLRFWVITEGAQGIGLMHPELTAVWGAARAFFSENPAWGGGLLDLEPSVPLDKVRSLIRACFESDIKSGAMIRQGRLLCLQLQASRNEASPGPSPVLRFQEGAYIVTGGFRGLAMSILEWLCVKGAPEVRLVGRSEPPTDAIQRIHYWRERGVNVRIHRGNVADAETLDALFAPGASSYPLKGVFHLAGVLDERLIVDQTEASVGSVMEGKCLGAWQLHCRTLRSAPEFFVMFSSAASLVPMPGQSVYAAANAFLDGLAAFRQGLGLPAIAVNWGTLRTVGHAASAYGRKAHQRLHEIGIEQMAVSDALVGLEEALVGKAAQTMIIRADWDKFLSYERHLGGWPLFAQFASSAPVEKTQLFHELQKLTGNERRAELQRLGADTVRKLMEIAPGTAVDMSTRFRDLGMDSFMTVRLRNKLQGALGVVLPATIAFEAPTIESVAGFIDEVCFQATAAGSDPIPERSDAATNGSLEGKLEHLEQLLGEQCQ